MHGGYGYTREYDVEQLYRDNRLNPIHEGTHGIQGLDLLGRKVVMGGGAGLALLGETIGEAVTRGMRAGGDAAEYAEPARCRGRPRRGHHRDAVVAWRPAGRAGELVDLPGGGRSRGRSPGSGSSSSSPSATGSGDFYDGKRAAARYFFRYELPATGPQFDLLDSLDRTTLDARPGWF